MTLQTPLISAVRIWDGGEPKLPDLMLPSCSSIENAREQVISKGQFVGSALDNLGEMASRICYDSAGTGRPSADFHKNIIKVNHLSVYEHCVFTIWVDVPRRDLAGTLIECMNKPALYVNVIEDPRPFEFVRVELTLNLRHVLEWKSGTFLHRIVTAFGQGLAPLVVEGSIGTGTTSCGLVDTPKLPQQQWITLLMTGSRGFSHELVRHGDWTAISQRSTRYVDENESLWVVHPLTAQFLRDADTVHRAPNGEATELSLGQKARHVIDIAQRTYASVIEKLEPWLISRGVDKFTARKQARGAARGYLGNALYTEVVFSASVSQWLHMLKMRACQAADAEIRECFCKALPELQGSRYGAAFDHLTLVPSPDGIGEVVIESPEPRGD